MRGRGTVSYCKSKVLFQAGATVEPEMSEVPAI